jgi:localization factor PodJL
MKSGVPWQVKGVRPQVRETAQEAARRSGMSVGEWLDTVIIDSAEADGVEPPAEALDDERYRDNTEPRRRRYADYDSRHRRPAEDDFAAVHDRLETLSLQLDQLARANAETARMPAREEETPRRIGDAISRLDRRLDQLISEGRSASSQIEQRMSAVDRAVAGLQPERPRLPSAAAPLATPLDQALVEIAARQQALDGGGSQPTGDWPTRADLPRASTQSLSGLEHQLRNITTRIETLRPGIDTAVETLRDDLAEIGVMLKEAMPRRAVEALEQEVRNLSERLHNGRGRGNGGGAAIAGLERGLAEVRDALRALTPAENLVGFDEAVKGLSDKIDRIATSSQDPAALQQLEGTIVALRGIVSHVASNDALAKLSDEMRVLASRVEQVAHSAGSGADVLATLEQRIATIADALHSRNHGDGGSHELEAVLLGLTDKLERIALTRGDQMALGHLEDRITKLVEKLDASDSRLNHLEAIERGLAELLIHLEHQRLPQAVRSAAAAPPLVDVLKRDVARTVDSLEAVHGTVEHVVDRLAMIETDMRGRPVAPADAPTPPPTVTPPPAMLPTAGTLPAPVPAPAAPAPAPVPRASALPPTEPPAPKPVRPPQEERRAIDPSLPPDYPLEPGVAGNRSRQPGSPADRIAASEAALGPAKPPVIPDPAGGKADFIAAARRAAQAAVNETPATVYSDKRAATEKAKPAAASLGSRISDRMRKLLVRSSAALLLVASLYAGVQVFGLFDQMTPPSTNVAAVPDPAPSGAAPVNQAAQLSERDATPAAPLTTATVIPAEPPSPAMIGPTTKNVADRVTTGSIPQTEPPAQPRLPAEPPAATRATAADRLPAAIGSGGLRTAAVRGDAAAEYEIAVRYADGRGVPPNMAAAAEWFERAAKQGLAPAQFRLGGFYEKGLGVKKDLEAARRLYLAAAQAGNAKAMHNLAVLYAEGAEGKPDYQTAARWFRKAADHGVADSQYNLAILYARGIGVSQNLAEAYKWFTLAAREGDKDSAKKRDDVGGRLDQPSLAAARLATETWTPEPQPEAAIQVKIPAGGWDGIAAPKQKARTVGPKAEAPAARP